MKKFLTFLLIFFILICITDFCLYSAFVYKQVKEVNSTNFDLPNNYVYSLSYKKLSDVFVDGSFLRPPVVFDSNKKILIFGCSYSYGASLEENQTFGYKLAQKYNGTVYNHSFPGWGLQHMYWQIDENKYNVLSYDKNIDTILYVFMEDHINRLYAFFSSSLFENIYNVRYSLKNGKLEQEKIVFPFINVFYLTKALRNYSYDSYKHSPNYDKNSCELVLALLSESNKKLKEKYPSAKFVLIEYNSDILKKIKKGISHSGWEYYSTNDFLQLNIDLNDENYHFKNDPHPTENAWDVVVDSIYKNNMI